MEIEILNNRRQDYCQIPTQGTILHHVHPTVVHCHGNHLGGPMLTQVMRYTRVEVKLSMRGQGGEDTMAWAWQREWQDIVWAEVGGQGRVH